MTALDLGPPNVWMEVALPSLDRYAASMQIVFPAVAGLVVALVLASGCDRKQTSTHSAAPAVDPKEAELASLPVGLEVTHMPNPVKARTPGKAGHQYAWVYKTQVRSLRGTVTIQEFGAFSWFQGRWVWSNFTGKAFTAHDFADWYSCAGARIVGGQAFSDPSNWSANDGLVSSKERWYYIGVDEQGQRVKGEAIVECLPQLDSTSAP